MSELWLMRHGETEWSANGRHTGLTDIPLTPYGRQQADRLHRRLNGRTFSLVLTSPLRRARETCALAGYEPQAIVEPDLHEWDYGAYEGRTSGDIREGRPDWDIWYDGVINGETVEAVGARTDRAIARALATPGDSAIFAHGHLLRVLVARWLGFEPSCGRLFALATASVSVLGVERDRHVVRLWNDGSHLEGMNDG